MASKSTSSGLGLDGFARVFGGAVIVPGDDAYEESRKLWNGYVDKQPAVIVQPNSAADVAAAVKHAQQAGLSLAVRGGGHSVAGHSMSQGGMTVDLGTRMRAVTVNADASRAKVGGGAQLLDLANGLSPYGRVVPFGHVSHTGVGGYTLGGGIGYAMRKYGLGCDSLVGAEVVTADGDVVYANAEENPDLFWALRGGGGNFGVVTEFEFSLQEFPTTLYAGIMVWPLEEAAAVFRFSRDLMHDAPEALQIHETFCTIPAAPGWPEDLHNKKGISLAVCWSGDYEEGVRVLDPLRKHIKPALDNLGPMTHPEVQQMLDRTAPHGLRNYNKAHYLAELPDEAIDVQVAQHEEVPSGWTVLINARMGGQVDRVDPASTAVGHRGAYRVAWICSQWEDTADNETEDPKNIEWCRKAFDALEPFSTGGVYVNALDDEGPERVRAAYDDATWERLVTVKEQWDPRNVFSQTYNITASPAPAVG